MSESVCVSHVVWCVDVGGIKVALAFILLWTSDLIVSVGSLALPHLKS